MKRAFIYDKGKLFIKNYILIFLLFSTCSAHIDSVRFVFYEGIEYSYPILIGDFHKLEEHYQAYTYFINNTYDTKGNKTKVLSGGIRKFDLVFSEYYDLRIIEDLLVYFILDTLMSAKEIYAITEDSLRSFHYKYFQEKVGRISDIQSQVIVYRHERSDTLYYGQGDYIFMNKNIVRTVDSCRYYSEFDKKWKNISCLSIIMETIRYRALQNSFPKK
jgi:hypothetical protein